MVAFSHQSESYSERLSIRLLSAAMLVGFCAFLNLYAPQPLLPLLSETFKASKVQVGLTITATTLAVAILAPIIGTLADLVGRKRIIVSAMFGMAIPTFFSAHSSTLHELIVWRFLQGIFMPGITAVIIAYITEEWSGMGVGRAIAMYVSGTVLGGFSGRFITGLVTDHFGWREAFIVLAALDVLSGIATWSWLPRSRRFVRIANWKSSFEAIGHHLRNKSLLATFGVGFSILFSLL
ncbi:MAG TPA: MFS transporter, partial [Blastocatellia bacterium]|nr:MFS transporter [Blastocatellia bacterium]